MDVVKPLRFQPTIVVCIGQPGRLVRDELALLLPSIDVHRQAGIAFLSVEGDRDEKGRLLASRFDLVADDMLETVLFPDENVRARGATAGETRLLTTLVVEALRGQTPPQTRTQSPRSDTSHTPSFGVLDDKVIQQIKDDGYDVPNAHVVVWLVVSPQSPLLKDVAPDIRRALKSESVSGKVLLALPNVYSTDLETRQRELEACRSQPWDTLLTGRDPNGNHEEPLVDFAYVFEARDEQGFYNNDVAHPNDIAFSIAEVIFTLMTTGVLGTPEMEVILRRDMLHLSGSPIQRMGGAGSSRLTFPRTHVEWYCASLMAAAIVRDWVPKDIPSNQQVLSVIQQDQKKEAYRWASRLDGGRGHETASTSMVIQALRAAKNGQGRFLNLPPNNPDDLIFRHFSTQELARHTQSVDGLPQLLKTQRSLAQDGLRSWRATIPQYWNKYEESLLADLDDHTKNDVLRERGALERIRLFFIGLDETMGTAKKNLANARARREKDYEAYLSKMERIGTQGPWAATLPSGDIEVDAPGAIAKPTQPNNQRLDPTLQTSPVDDQDQADANTAPPVPFSQEDRIILQLTERYEWYVRNPPGRRSIAPIAAMSTPPMVLLEIALLSLPIPLFASPLGALALTVVTFALLNVGGRFLLPEHHELEEARNDLISFYRIMFKYQADVVEDEQREALLVGLHYEVRSCLDRLQNWDSFVASLSSLLEEKGTKSAEADMFDRAIGRRDIFVANQQMLRKDGYQLADLERDIARRRVEHPKQGKEWHAQNRDILGHMRDAIPASVSLLKSTPAQIVRPIFTFCRAIVREYLDGAISDIGMALQAMPSTEQSGLFSRLVDQSRILYLPQTGSRHTAVLFVSSRDEYRRYVQESAISRDAVMMRILDRDWLGTVRISRGDEAPSFWAGQNNGPMIPDRPTWGPSQGGSPESANGAHDVNDQGFAPPMP